MSRFSETEYFSQPGKVFQVEGQQWVSLRAKWISLHILPELGPCMIIQQKNRSHVKKTIQFKLERKIKRKTNPDNPHDNYGLIFKASKLQGSTPAAERIYAAKFSQLKDDGEFMDTFLYLFKEWDENDQARSDHWSCSMCTFINKASQNRCEMCPSYRFRNSSSVTVSETGSTWSCSSCSHLNFGMGNVCTACNRKTSDERVFTSSSTLRLSRNDSLDSKDEGWLCELCTLQNEEDNDKCKLCYAVRKDDYIKMRDLSDNIIKLNRDPTILFQTLSTICQHLHIRSESCRTLYVHQKRVENRLISFNGGIEFLNLLGFQPDDKNETLKCPINKPDTSTLEHATKVINRALRILQRDSSTTSSIPEQKWSRQKSKEMPVSADQEVYMSRPKLYSRCTRKIVQHLEDSNRAHDVVEWFDQDEVEECETINNILDKGLNPERRDVLLLVYKSFCSSEMLLRVLVQRWKASDFEVRKKILVFCIHWTNLYFEDMMQPSFGGMFWSFARECLKTQQAGTQKLARTLMKILEKQDSEKNYNQDLQVRCLAKVNKDLTVLDFNTMDIAKAVTLLDFEQFKQINHRELLNQAWMKKDNKKRAPTVLKMIAQFNIISKWTQVCILSARGLLQRKKTIHWFINLTADFIRINNFSSFIAVTSGLTSNNIHCLKHAWEDIKSNNKVFADHNGHIKLFSPSRNHHPLRALLKKRKLPVMPHIGLLLKDIAMSGDDFLVRGDNSGNKVNFKKCTKLAKRIWDGFGKFQETQFEFQRDDVILSWLKYNQAKVLDIVDAFFEKLSDQAISMDAAEKVSRGSGIWSKIFT